jgi:hypothetical protein
VAQIKASPRKNIIVLRDFLTAAASKHRDKGGESLFNLALQVMQIEAAMKESGFSYPRLEVKLPVKGHRDSLAQSDTVYVAVAPLEDESQVQSVVAYNKGEQLALSVKEPPKIPTFVIAPAESDSVEPEPPLTISDKPRDEENPERVVDDFVGIPWILITDDHESWPCGDPEIYVKISRWDLINGSWQFFSSNTDLTGVNDENVWYWLGELGYNNTYRVLGSTFWRVVQYAFWESDSGAHGSDDFLGSINVTWTALPFGGYTSFSSGDVRFYVDRD